MVYWLVALQLPNKRKDAAWELLQERTSAASLSSNAKLDIPELRVGTLDSLMALSDELSKVSQMMDAVVNKVKRQVSDAGGAKSLTSLKVDGKSTESFVQHFKWDEAKFPARRPLKDTVERMVELVSRIEDDLKARWPVGIMRM
jgi:V-type H+-transporting ATPase subunit C